MKIHDAATTRHAPPFNALIGALCRGEVNGRRSASERTVFKFVGTALEDLAAATLVHRSAA